MENQEFYTLVITQSNDFYSLGNLYDMSKEVPSFVKKIMVLEKELLN